MRRVFLCLFFVTSLFGDTGTLEEKPHVNVPWFTGPLVSPAANVVREGHYNIEPYLFVTKYPSIYDNDWHANSIPTEWRIQLLVPIWVGLTDWCDVKFSPNASWQHKQNGAGGAWTLGDLILQFDFQLWGEQYPYKTWLPSIKLGIGEVLPMGRYRNLNPMKLGIDQGGLGSWSTLIELVFGRIFYFNDFRYLSWRLSFDAIVYQSPIHVKGYHAYGGGMGANGRVFPGQNLQIDCSFEYSLSRHWALAIDLIGYWQTSSKVVGNQGVNPLVSTHTFIAKEAAIEYSVAPAIEYNWNENLGIITGAWFTVAGKQMSKYFTFSFAVNYYK